MGGVGESVGESMVCPECGAGVPVEGRWRPWCTECEWNLDASPPISPRAARAAHRNEARAERLLRHGGRGGRGAGARLATALSGLVLGSTVLVLAAALAMVVLGRHSPVVVGLGVILLAAAVMVRPRPARLDDRAVVVEPGAAPVLWGLLAEVAERVGGRPPDVVVVDLVPNASVGNIGLRSRTVLRIGFPLWVVLDRQERVGLLAHELVVGVVRAPVDVELGLAALAPRWAHAYGGALDRRGVGFGDRPLADGGRAAGRAAVGPGGRAGWLATTPMPACSTGSTRSGGWARRPGWRSCGSRLT